MLAKVTQIVSDGGGVGTRSLVPESVLSVTTQCSQVISQSLISCQGDSQDEGLLLFLINCVIPGKGLRVSQMKLR